MEIKERNISELIPAEYNPRYITDEALEQLKASIQRFDAVEPVLVNVHPERSNIIISGHQRIKAAKSLGLETFPCVELNLDKDKERELNVRMNKNTGAWDWEELATYFDTEELTDWGFTEEELFGDGAFDDEELESEEDDYELPEEIETDFVLGDLIEIGDHRLLCGDSTDSDQVAKLMDGDKADMVFTDPPYNINYGNINHPKFKVRNIENDNMDSKSFKDFCDAFCSVIKLNTDGVVYCAGPPGKDGRIMFSSLDDSLHCSTVIIWNKDQFTLGRGKYQNKYEPIWFGWNKSGESFTEDRTLTNVWDIDRPKSSKEHPTMKPLKIIDTALNHNQSCKSVLDLFLGSGSTMVACHQLNRKCYGMELDPKYCQVIVDRMLKLDPSLEVKVNGDIYEQD